MAAPVIIRPRSRFSSSHSVLTFLLERDCGSNGVSGPTASGLRAWRERCRDDRDTGWHAEEEGQAGS
jgi:hypothetical protein